MGLKEKIDEAVTIYKVELNTDFCTGPNFIDQFGFSEPVYFTSKDAADACYNRLIESFNGHPLKINDSLEAKFKGYSAPSDAEQREICSQSSITYFSDERGGGHVVHRVMLSSCKVDRGTIEEKVVVTRQYHRKEDGKMYELQ
ncbi:MAG: hypothetical protein NTV63_01765 [Candidatus Woesearchaeota archaeon]|nr:hypothetical protein [Candidatus Woesearchaeota archaeon]